MTTSKAIAGLLGPTLVAAAVAMLLNLGSLPALTEEVSREPVLILLSGILLFVAGLAIVRVHNRWASGWPMLVTVLGWLFVIGGHECYSQFSWPQSWWGSSAAIPA